MSATPIARAAAAAVLAAAVAAHAATAPARPSLGRPFTLAAGFQPGYGAGPAALGPDGTAWIAQAGFGSSPASGFEILARAAGGRVLGPVATSDGGGSATDRPVIAAGPGAATFVWQTASGIGGQGGVAQVRARRCTLAGCGPVQVLASWSWSAGGRVGGSGFTAVGDAEPGAAIAGSRTLAVFYRDGGGAPRMEWTVATGAGPFASARPLAGPGGPDAVVAPLAGGGAVAAWAAGTLPSLGSRVEWTAFAPRGGFARAAALAGPAGSISGLAAAPAGAGAALVWLQGTNVSEPIPAEPVWVARRGAAGGFSRPARAFGGDAFGLSLAGGAGTLAIAFTTAAGPRAGPGQPGPAWVKRSAGGGPFGAAVDLDPRAAPYPAVAVTTGGGVLAAWSACPASGAAMCTAQLAFAPPGAGFGGPVALGAEARGGSPTIAVSGARALVAWESGDAVRAVVATFRR